MAIEFQCPHCGKTLKTSDDKAGANAKCPGCSELITIPANGSNGGAEADSPATEAQYQAENEDVGDKPPERHSSAEHAQRKPSNSDTSERQPCPMCGESIPISAKRCRHCGESLVEEEATNQFEPTVVEIGPIWETAWEKFKAEMGMMIAIILIAGAIGGALTVPGTIFNAFARHSNIEPSVIVGVAIVNNLIQMACQLWLAIGQTICFLNFAKGKKVEISQMFSGGKYYLRALGASIIFGILYSIGALLCIVPGVFVALMFWPYLYILVDQDASVSESFSTSRAITTGNFGTSFLLGLMILGLYVAGFFALCIGLIFAIPLCNTLVATTYLAMSGQIRPGVNSR